MRRAGRIFTKADSAPSDPSDDSRLDVHQTTRAAPSGREGPSAASPFSVAETGTGSLTTDTDVGRDLYLAEFHTYYHSRPVGVKNEFGKNPR